MGFLAGKRALIVGVATDRSIAWGIAQAMHREGAALALSYANDKFKERVVPLAQTLGALTLPLDVSRDEEIAAAFDYLRQEWGSLDILVHAVAFAPREALAGSFLDNTSREAFQVAHDVSSYSLTALSRGAVPLMVGPRGRRADPVLPGGGAQPPQLQRHGPGQSEPGGQCALPGGGSGAAWHPGERHFGRPGEDPGGRGHRRLSQDARPRGRGRAAAPQCDPGGCGQCRRLFVLGPGGRHHR